MQTQNLETEYKLLQAQNEAKRMEILFLKERLKNHENKAIRRIDELSSMVKEKIEIIQRLETELEKASQLPVEEEVQHVAAQFFPEIIQIPDIQNQVPKKNVIDEVQLQNIPPKDKEEVIDLCQPKVNEQQVSKPERENRLEEGEIDEGGMIEIVDDEEEEIPSSIVEKPLKKRIVSDDEFSSSPIAKDVPKYDIEALNILYFDGEDSVIEEAHVISIDGENYYFADEILEILTKKDADKLRKVIKTGKSKAIEKIHDYNLYQECKEIGIIRYIKATNIVVLIKTDWVEWKKLNVTIDYDSDSDYEESESLGKEPSKPSNGYISFCMERRDELVEQGISRNEAWNQAKKEWSQMTKKDKKPFLEIYKQKQKIYTQKMDNYNETRKRKRI